MTCESLNEFRVLVQSKGFDLYKTAEQVVFV
jgi:hypothetical protein